MKSFSCGFLVLSISSLLFWSCEWPPTTQNSPRPIAWEPPPASPDQMLGQVLLLQIRYGSDGTPLYHLDTDTKNLIRDLQPGGILFFRQNLQSVSQIEALMAEIRSLLRIPPFLAIDEEGGRVSRLKWLSEAWHEPSARTLAARGNRAIGAAYDFIGGQMAKLGFNMDFGPVADLGWHPELEFLGDRSFSADPAVVSQAIDTAVRALQAHKILSIVKHFPGHGRSSGDSHQVGNLVTASRGELAADLQPFRVAFTAGAAGVMSAHVAYQAYDSSGLPASLSAPILQNLARNQLRFDGLIITDALEMRGLTTVKTEEDAAVAAFVAGADLLMGATNPRLIRLKLQAAAKTAIVQKRLIDSYRRILKIKHQFEITP
jgi:beta-N-acetylhexosaminidase